uniref:Uncharacterized protein n=1 Tax=Kalanchoe fedtschenkoi TaxID=63787 RepID=A0A7N0VBI0_KALFE
MVACITLKSAPDTSHQPTSRHLKLSIQSNCPLIWMGLCSPQPMCGAAVWPS